jgi:hypothetical protein
MHVRIREHDLAHFFMEVERNAPSINYLPTCKLTCKYFQQILDMIDLTIKVVDYILSRLLGLYYSLIHNNMHDHLQLLLVTFGRMKVPSYN